VACLRTLLAREPGRHPFPDQADLLTGELTPEMLAILDFAVSLVEAEQIEPGHRYAGRLESDDLVVDRLTDVYRFAGRGGQQVSIDVHSSEFDAVVEIVEEETMFTDDEWTAVNDDGGPGTDARILRTLPRSGDYLVFVYSYGSGTGSYTLSLAEDQSRYRETGDRWFLFSYSSDGTLYYDTETISRRGSRTTVWTMLRCDGVEQAPDGMYYDSRRERWIVDCGQGRMALQSLYFFRQDEVVKSFDVPSHMLDWSSIAPESVGEALQNAVCR
jgi:hypothetical protein